MIWDAGMLLSCLQISLPMALHTTETNSGATLKKYSIKDTISGELTVMAYFV